MVDNGEHAARLQSIFQFRKEFRTVDLRPAIVHINVVDIVIREYQHYGIKFCGRQFQLVILRQQNFNVSETVVGIPIDGFVTNESGIGIVGMRDDFAVGPDDMREHLGVVAAAREHVEHRHPRRDPEEFQYLARLASGITFPIGVGPSRAGDCKLINGNRRDARSGSRMPGALCRSGGLAAANQCQQCERQDYSGLHGCS